MALCLWPNSESGPPRKKVGQPWFRPRIDVIKNGNKEVFSEGSKVMDRWKIYCEKLYTENRTIETSHITSHFECEQEPLPTISEVEKAIKEIKMGKVRAMMRFQQN